MRLPRALTLTLLIVASGFAHAATGLEPMEFDVDGVARTALVYTPPDAKATPTPMVFIFHGHGGTAERVARTFHLETKWPEAICVYMQGLPTPGQLSDPNGERAGWQSAPGAQDDRDLKFFDAVLARLKKDYRVDASRIYGTGHSNGGGFTYLLWLMRPEVLAAVAPSSAAAAYARRLPPKPALILGGSNDPLVKFAWQERTMNAVRQVNGCAETGQRWAKVCTEYPSKIGTPLVTYIFPGGHQFDAAEPALIAQFFKEHPGGHPAPE